MHMPISISDRPRLMTNVWAMVFLILASLVTSWALSPAQEKLISGEDVIVKQGHRGVVVEFVEDDGNYTKIWISPDHEINAKEKLSETKENSKEKIIKEHGGFSPKELVCDVYGKCKRKVLESAMGKAKEGANEVEEEAYDKARDAKSEAKPLEIAKKGACGVKEEEKKDLSDILRRAREVAFDILEYATPPLSTVLVALHLLGLAAAYGMCVWVTFASGHVLATALPRHQLCVAQSKIYPVYFKAMACSVGMALLGHLTSIQTASPNHDHIGTFQVCNLMMSISMILANLLYLQPRATKMILERMKEEGRGKQSGKKSQMLNSFSSLLNFITLMSLTCHLLHLGRRLHSCS